MATQSFGTASSSRQVARIRVFVMNTSRFDWQIDVPIPCATCGMEAVARIAELKARNSIDCRNCGASIDLTDPGTRAFVDELSSVVTYLCSSSMEAAKES
jgi:transcription elongation factor Elf1